MLSAFVISYGSFEKRITNLLNASVGVSANKKLSACKQDNEYAIYYVVVADTSQNYFTLRHKLFALNKSLGLKIDTMNRTYNKKKNLIALPDPSPDDDMYAGEYYPGRFASESLSLEYLKEYKDDTKEKTIALVTGIYETKAKADFALRKLKTKERKAFIVKSKIFIGCMH